MKKTQTAAEHNGDDSAVEPNVLDCASALYADWRSIGFNREDVLMLLCGLLVVAVSDNPRKARREKTHRPKAKGEIRAATGSS